MFRSNLFGLEWTDLVERHMVLIYIQVKEYMLVGDKLNYEEKRKVVVLYTLLMI